MKTDYQNLTKFETGTVAVIVIGFGLIVAMLVSGLPQTQQTQFTQAVQIFDLHNEWQEPVAAVTLVFAASSRLLDGFYVAFAQTAVVPQEQLAAASRLTQAVMNYSDQLAVGYGQERRVVRADEELKHLGRVLGESIIQLIK